MLKLPSSFKVEEVPNHLFNVHNINSISKKYPELRQKSKAPTFALTFQGTSHTLVKNIGFTQEEAEEIEQNYHKLYEVSDQWVQDRIKQAAKDGYAEAAFGLKIRVPLLKQVLYGSSSMPPAAAAEARTLGNAISGQSYGLLNNRAANEFMQKVWASRHRYDVLPCAQIHDAQYYLVRDDIEVVEWVNRELIKSMQWQELPEIQHDQVKLGAALDLFYNGWHQPITLPNNASIMEILKLAKEGAAEYDKVTY